MTSVFATIEAPTAAELVREADSRRGAGVRLGAATLTRFGAAVIPALGDTPVFADARISGRPDDITVAAKALASVGARYVSIDVRSEVDAIDAAVFAAAQHAAEIVLVGVPPGAPEPATGRGRAVTRAARRAQETSARLLLGEIPDLGVVAQVSSALGVIVEVGGPDEAVDAIDRGAVGLVVHARDAVRSIVELTARSVPSDHG